MLRGLGLSGRVPSPTYTLLEQYDVGDLTVVHLDLYRLAAMPSSRTSGCATGSPTRTPGSLFEWPERAPRSPGAAI